MGKSSLMNEKRSFFPKRGLLQKAALDKKNPFYILF
jgi:hypothetical protein